MRSVVSQKPRSQAAPAVVVRTTSLGWDSTPARGRSSRPRPPGPTSGLALLSRGRWSQRLGQEWTLGDLVTLALLAQPTLMAAESGDGDQQVA